MTPRGLQEAIARALVNEDLRFAETRWSDSISSGGEIPSWGGQRFLSRVVDSRTIEVAASPHSAMTPIRQIGGEKGWYYGDWLWGLRGFLDLLMGGVGVRRGRRDPEIPYVGDTVDFWRVEVYEPDHFLRLRAEMKVPDELGWNLKCARPKLPMALPVVQFAKRHYSIRSAYLVFAIGIRFILCINLSSQVCFEILGSKQNELNENQRPPIPSLDSITS